MHSWGGAICILGGVICILGGYTLQSWRVRFAFWGYIHFAFLEGVICMGGVHFAFLGGTLCIPGIHCIFRGCIIHFGGTLCIPGIQCIFIGCIIHFWGTLCILYIYSAFLEDALSLLGVHFVFLGVYLSFWIVGTLCFLGIALIINKFMDGDSYYGYTAFLDRYFVLECIHISMYMCPHYYTSRTHPHGQW